MNKKTTIILVIILIISIGYNISFFKKQYSGNNINNIEKINNKKDIIIFKNKSLLPESILFFAIKHKNKIKWNLYWIDIYEKYGNLQFSKNNFENYINKVFLNIVDNTLELDVNNKYLLDGGIFFSSSNINEKINKCNMRFGKKINISIINKIQQCINFSYYYKAIIDKDINICKKIFDNGVKNNMKEDCLELLK